MKIDKHIEIVSSTVVSLSSMSKESRDAIRAVLAKHYTKVGITIVNDMDDLAKLVRKKPDLVFLGMKFVPRNPHLGSHDPQKIWLAHYLGSHGIAYTGSGHEAHNIELDKPQAKQRVLESGLKTSQYMVARIGDAPITENSVFGYPLFVKPTNRGGGLGIDSNSVVRNYAALQSKIASIFADLHSDALIEKYLSGREFSVAILKDELTSEYTAMPLELVAAQDDNGSRLLSAEVKSSNAEVVSMVTDQVIKTRVCSLATDVFHALGGRDYGRIDIRLDEFGEAHFLEANLLPSLISGYGSFPKACDMNIGLGYEEMINRIVRLGLARVADEPSVTDSLIPYPLVPAVIR
jgi:D-alanine-D-alanine ligase